MDKMNLQGFDYLLRAREASGAATDALAGVKLPGAAVADPSALGAGESAGVKLPDAAVADLFALGADDFAGVKLSGAVAADPSALGAGDSAGVKLSGAAAADPSALGADRLRRALNAVSPAAAAQARRFHAGLPGYAETPLWRMDALARALGVGRIYVKDESRRFGLNAFKALGGGFAMGCCLAERLGKRIDEVTFEELTAPSARAALGEVTFITATDGNHGRGVAWMAKRLGQRAVVYLPKGSAPERLENILREGADARVTELNYDGAVHLAARHARENGWILTQDTAWDGYEAIPARIMQGYTTIGSEIVDQLAAMGEAMPTHLLLQAGVGSFAAAILGYFAAVCGAARPVGVIVEPTAADCLLRSARAGEMRFVRGDMPTIMAGLACGEPSSLAFEILNAYADAFVACPDAAAAGGMRLLGNPCGGDPRIVSGESGAAGAGLLRELMRRDALRALREALGLDARARVLLINTEGDTDRENYRRVVWDGAHANLP